MPRLLRLWRQRNSGKSQDREGLPRTKTPQDAGPAGSFSEEEEWYLCCGFSQ